MHGRHGGLMSETGVFTDLLLEATIVHRSQLLNDLHLSFVLNCLIILVLGLILFCQDEMALIVVRIFAIPCD